MVPLGPHPCRATSPSQHPCFQEGTGFLVELWAFSLLALAAPHLLAVTASCTWFQSSLLHCTLFFCLWALRLQSTGLHRLQFDLLPFPGQLLPVSTASGLLVFLFRLWVLFFFFFLFLCCRAPSASRPFYGFIQCFSSHFIAVTSSSPRQPCDTSTSANTIPGLSVEQGPLFPGRQGCCFAFALWPFPAEESRAWEGSNAQFFLHCCALCSTLQSWLSERNVLYSPLQHMLPLGCVGHSPPPCSTLPSVRFSQIDTIQFLMPNSYSENTFLLLTGEMINTALPSQSHYPQ